MCCSPRFDDGRDGPPRHLGELRQRRRRHSQRWQDHGEGGLRGGRGAFAGARTSRGRHHRGHVRGPRPRRAEAVTEAEARLEQEQQTDDTGTMVVTEADVKVEKPVTEYCVSLRDEALEQELTAEPEGGVGVSSSPVPSRSPGRDGVSRSPVPLPTPSQPAQPDPVEPMEQDPEPSAGKPARRGHRREERQKERRESYRKERTVKQHERRRLDRREVRHKEVERCKEQAFAGCEQV